MAKPRTIHACRPAAPNIPAGTGAARIAAPGTAGRGDFRARRGPRPGPGRGACEHGGRRCGRREAAAALGDRRRCEPADRDAASTSSIACWAAASCPGSVVLLGGEPGIGKSTLALQLAGRLAATGRRCSTSAARRVPEQIRLRAERLEGLGGCAPDPDETRVEALAAPLARPRPSVVVIDSIQTMTTERVESAAGSVAQVRECAALLAATAKRLGAVLLLIGHVTKDGRSPGRGCSSIWSTSC